MITLRKSEDRGRSAHGGWLQSAHSFSFGSYFDLKHQGHGNLLVINDDTVAGGHGFGTHGHRDMEIISYVLDGELAHKDSMGNGAADAVNSGIIRPGDVQRMSAGFGVTHSEFNNLPDRSTRFLQIWILPKFKGIRPSYEQKHFSVEQRRGRLVQVVSQTGENGSLSMNADAALYAGLFNGSESATMELDTSRLAYVHLARGRLTVNGHDLKEGDGALLEDEKQLILQNGQDAEVIFFDLARR